eukprot:5990417-Prymnesium_polylepis.1
MRRPRRVCRVDYSAQVDVDAVEADDEWACRKKRRREAPEHRVAATPLVKAATLPWSTFRHGNHAYVWRSVAA